MSMGMNLGLAMVPVQSLQLSARHLLELNQSLTFTLDILEVVRGVKYIPKAKCQNCSKDLNVAEIITGFNDNVNDFTTQCPKCHSRFKAQLISHFAAGTMELPFYCASQTCNQLRPLAHLNLEDFRKDYPAVYHSAIVHYGTLARAFREIDIEYQFDETVAWKDKIIPFLGRMSDFKIAGILNVPPKEVRDLRKQLQIPAFRK